MAKPRQMSIEQPGGNTVEKRTVRAPIVGLKDENGELFSSSWHGGFIVAGKKLTGSLRQKTGQHFYSYV